MGNCFGINKKKSYNEPLLSASEIRFHQEETKTNLDYNNINIKNTGITFNIKWIDSEINKINNIIIPNLLSSKCDLSEIKIRVSLIGERIKIFENDIEKINDSFLSQSMNSSIFNKSNDSTILKTYYNDVTKRYNTLYKVIHSIENGKNLANAVNY